MNFNDEKKKYLALLYKPDKSKKGDVDEEIINVLDRINKQDNYYTTSSCAGRINILIVPKSGKKYDVKWLFVSHSEVDYEDVQKIIEQLSKFDEPVYFKEEAPILHVACRNLDDAQELVTSAKLAGFKRSGIMGIKKRIMVELTSTEFLDAPLSNKNKLFVDEEYIKILIKEGNKKLKRARKKLDKLIQILEDRIKRKKS